MHALGILQYLYGPSKTTRTRNDVYKLVEGDANFIWDGGGTDTIDGQLMTKGMTIDLNPGPGAISGPRPTTSPPLDR